MKNLSKLSFIGLFFFLFSCASPGNAQISNLNVDDFVKTYKATKAATLLDVRTPGEWAQGKLKGSETINFNSPDFSQQIIKLDKTKPVFVYCAVGGRSSRAAEVLSKAGYKVFNLTSAGYSQLAQKGL